MNFVDSAELLEAVEGWDWVEAMDDRPDVEHVAHLVAAIQRVKKTLALAEDDLSQFLWREVPVGEVVQVDGVPYRMRGGSKREAWDHDDVRRDLQKVIADRLAASPFVVEQVVEAWTAACGYQWKTTGLRSYGLDPDEYCHVSKGPPRLAQV